MTDAAAILFKIEQQYAVVYPGNTPEEQQAVRSSILIKIEEMLVKQAAQADDMLTGLISVKAGAYSEQRGAVMSNKTNDAEAGGIALTPLDIVRKYATLYRKHIEVVE